MVRAVVGLSVFWMIARPSGKTVMVCGGLVNRSMCALAEGLSSVGSEAARRARSRRVVVAGSTWTAFRPQSVSASMRGVPSRNSKRCWWQQGQDPASAA